MKYTGTTPRPQRTRDRSLRSLARYGRHDGRTPRREAHQPFPTDSEVIRPTSHSNSPRPPALFSAKTNASAVGIEHLPQGARRHWHTHARRALWVVEGIRLRSTAFRRANAPEITEGVQAANGREVIAIGGGSAIDAGKAIATLVTNPGEPLDYLKSSAAANRSLRRPRYRHPDHRRHGRGGHAQCCDHLP